MEPEVPEGEDPAVHAIQTGSALLLSLVAIIRLVLPLFKRNKK